MKGNEESLRLAEADGWEVHEVAKAPVCLPNSPEDIRQSMDLLQQIHREAHADEPSVEQFEVKMKAARESNGLHLLRVACTCPSDTELDPRCFVAFPHPWHAARSSI